MLVDPSAATLDTDRLDELAGLQDEGVELVPEIVRMFVTDTDKWLTRASDAVHGANVLGLRIIAHNLAGACGTIGAVRMQGLATALEASLAQGNLEAAGSSVQMLIEEFGQVRAALAPYTAADSERASRQLALHIHQTAGGRS